jgi:hypothetical protein
MTDETDTSWREPPAGVLRKIPPGAGPAEVIEILKENFKTLNCWVEAARLLYGGSEIEGIEEALGTLGRLLVARTRYVEILQPGS